MKWLNSKSPSKLAALMVSAAVFGLASQSAAALTGSGTAISNIASLTYNVGGTTQIAIESKPGGNSIAGVGQGVATSFVVDKKVDFTVTGGAIVNVQPNQAGLNGTPPSAANSNTVLTYTVTNNGNDAQGFILTAANATAAVATDVFDPTAIRVFVETDGVAGYSAGDTATAIASLAPGTTVTVYVLSTIPTVLATAAPIARLAGSPLANNDKALVTLSAQAAVVGTPVAVGNPAGTAGAALVATAAAPGANATGGANVSSIDIVFAEAANTAPVDAANNGIAVANGTYNIQTASLNVTKLSSVVCDPVTGNVAPNNIPGAAIQWAITISNAVGSLPANLALPNAISDTLSQSTTFDPNKVTGLTAATCLLGNATGFAPANGLGYTLGTAAPAAGAAPVTIAPAGAFTLTAPVAGVGGNGGIVNINFATLLPAGVGRATAGDLNAGEFITVYFNVFVN